MSDDVQVAVYFDFDNIVISRYDELYGQRAFHEDKAATRPQTEPVKSRLAQAHVDIGAIMDYATSFGAVAISRAYANWAIPVNASYAPDLLRSSIDLVQMFPLSGSKNGADIRLAIDVIDDLSRHTHITHVLVVAGDSDYISLAQRCRRLGREVIGVGAARSVGKYWEAACDEFRYYGNLLVVANVEKAPSAEPPTTPRAAESGNKPGALLVRAARLQHAKSTSEWIAGSSLKNLMLRLDPAFDEAASGHRTFTKFLQSHPKLVDVRTGENGTWVHLRELGPAD
ncbi:MAG: NYN domain-containing protein [Actinomycetota bacterium]|nr:NYN domain-containing protein [Actinomycetota bacterium]